MIPGAESVGILELDALIKMPMPDEDLEEEVEKELCQQATARMRAYKRSRGEEVESEVEMYEDLEPLLVQEVELEGDIVMAGPSSTALLELCCPCIILYVFVSMIQWLGP